MAARVTDFPASGVNALQERANDIDVEDCYRRYGPFVLRRCRALLRDDDHAVDAMHDVFVQVLNHAGSITPTAIAGLLHRIATNVCLNRLRTEKRKPLDADDELLLRIAADVEPGAQTAAARFLQSLFSRVPVSSREIAVLHLLDGMTLEETAHEVGLSVSGVRKRLRALASVGRELDAT